MHRYEVTVSEGMSIAICNLMFVQFLNNVRSLKGSYCQSFAVAFLYIHDAPACPSINPLIETLLENSVYSRWGPQWPTQSAKGIDYQVSSYTTKAQFNPGPANL